MKDGFMIFFEKLQRVTFSCLPERKRDNSWPGGHTGEDTVKSVNVTPPRPMASMLGVGASSASVGVLML